MIQPYPQASARLHRPSRSVSAQGEGEIGLSGEVTITSKIPQRVVDEYQDEVVAALRMIGNPRLGAAVAKDRGSSIEHLGIPFPALRKRVKEGFSFYDLPADEVLAIWNRLWRTSPYGDVLFAAIEYYAPLVRKRVSPTYWPVMRTWHERVDNWCHSDGLSSVYSWILASDPAAVYPQLVKWNRAEDEWLRRISLVSLIHYSGKNAVFVSLKRALPLVTTCLTDDREYVQKAVGWVLREMGHAYPDAVNAYIRKNITTITAVALRRAIERSSPAAKAELLALSRSSSRPTRQSRR